MTLQQMKYVVTIADTKSINKAAAELFITQPSLSATIHDLEEELGIEIFIRSNRGVTLTSEGEEFLGYARQMLEHYRLIEDRFVTKEDSRKKFSVSSQHYTFAVEAFMHVVRHYGMSKFDFAMHETKTHEVIENVRTMKSELGILYLNDFNRSVLEKIFRRDELEFVPLFDCHIYVFMAKKHPLATKKKIKMRDLDQYPCLSFEQGNANSFYFAEEVMSTYDYKQVLHADDRATFLNMMVGLNGFTLCSGIICNELNGDGYVAVPLDTKDTMTIGYIKLARMPLSAIGKEYVDELKTYEKNAL